MDKSNHFYLSYEYYSTEKFISNFNESIKRKTQYITIIKITVIGTAIYSSYFVQIKHII